MQKIEETHTQKKKSARRNKKHIFACTNYEKICDEVCENENENVYVNPSCKLKIIDCHGFRMGIFSINMAYICTAIIHTHSQRTHKC